MYKEKGFTLLEILLTILLVTGGFIVLLQAASIGLFAGGENQNELIAVNLAQEKMEDIRNTAYANIGNEAKAAVSGFPAFQREVVFTIPQTGLKLVTVNVYWFAKGSELSTSLVTYVSSIN